MPHCFYFSTIPETGRSINTMLTKSLRIERSMSRAEQRWQLLMFYWILWQPL